MAKTPRNAMFSPYPQVSTDSQLRKLEEQLSEANTRGDDLQKALTEVNVARNRLTGTRTSADTQPHTRPSESSKPLACLQCLVQSGLTFYLA